MNKPKGTKPKAKTSSKKIDLEPVNFNSSQLELIKKIHKNRIVLVHGPAGTAKTSTTLYAAFEMLNDAKVNAIQMTKPIEESGEKLGFLPGTIDEKIAPHIESFYNATEMFADRKAVEFLGATKELDFQPLAYLRGRTFSNKLVILDEAQNCDFRQLMLFITRLGKNSKMVILGDTSQYDIKENKVALTSFIKMLEGIPGIVTHEFQKSDIVRESILIEICDRYDQWKSEGKVTSSK